MPPSMTPDEARLWTLLEAERLLAAAMTGHECEPNGAHLRRGELADIEMALHLIRTDLRRDA